MSGERDLEVLLASMAPVVRPGEHVVVTVDGVPPADLAVLASVVEDEGLSLVLRRSDADRLGLAYDVVLGWITLTVHSALDAVGLTAAVATALAARGISCNVVAGRHHDHLLVPVADVERAVDALEALAARPDADPGH